MSTITIAYAVNPRADASAAASSTPPASGTIRCPFPPTSSTSPDALRSPTAAYYAAAAPALRAAQAQLMDALTAWKDAVGDAEKHLENAPSAKGQGKAARMMMATKKVDAESSSEEDEEDDEEDEEESDE